jgi:hypothetical protein
MTYRETHINEPISLPSASLVFLVLPEAVTVFLVIQILSQQPREDTIFLCRHHHFFAAY